MTGWSSPEAGFGLGAMGAATRPFAGQARSYTYRVIMQGRPCAANTGYTYRVIM